MHNSQCTITYPKQKMTHKIYEDAIYPLLLQLSNF